MGIRGAKAIWDADTDGIELLDVTIGDLLDDRARSFPDIEAIVYRYPEIGLNLRMTYRQYQAEADRLAKGLLSLGINKGEHVAVWATNVPEWPLLEMALAKIGAVMVTINTNYRAAELEYVLRQGDVSTLFLIPSYRDNSFVDAAYSAAPELKDLQDPTAGKLRCAGLPRLLRVVLIGETPAPGMLSYQQVVAMGDTVPDQELRRRQAMVSPQDVAMIQFTSGTTGFPKGVMLTHHASVNNAMLLGHRWEWQPDERLITGMPFFHAAGSLLFILGGLAAGVTVIPLITFDAGKQLELIAQEKATFTLAVPTMLIAMLNHPQLAGGQVDVSSMRRFSSGGAPVPVALMEQIKEKTGADVAIAFGQTESSGIIATTRARDPFELASSTVGIPLPHTEVKIVDAGGEPVLQGEPGELMFRGYQAMRGYYKMPEMTAEVMDSDGWLHTGDLATMNQDGYVNIVGRLKDMVIRGGENLYPVEVEAFLMRHPKIAEAQVIGVPDLFMGEELCAALRCKPGEVATEGEIQEYCRAGISRQKVPRYIKFVSEFPLTASGKVRKFELKEQMIRELGLEEAARLRTA
jgi:fatty-acyl-CoA synthase